MIMRKRFHISLLKFAFFSLTCIPALVFAQTPQSTKGVFVKELSAVKWNTPDGIPYVKGPGSDLGATSFEVMDASRIAYLSNASNEIIITKTSDGTAMKKFPVASAPRDFVYDNGFFYVLFSQQVTVYDESGKTINSFTFPIPYMGVERLTRYNKETYLLLPAGNCAKIESAGQAVTPEEYEGWITSASSFVSTKLSSDKAYSVSVRSANGKSYTKEFTADKKVAGVYVIGSTENRLVIEVQSFISESPIAVERNIVSIELNKKEEMVSIAVSKKVPDCNYVHSNKNFSVSPDGNILNMITAPNGIYVFSLAESISTSAQDYPAEIKDMKYHFNDHMIKVDEQ
jgi:hypothetical protein